MSIIPKGPLPTEAYIQAGSQQLHCLTWGGGSELLLVFHGYGEQASFCDLFVPFLTNRYTIVSINLPYHGGSQWEHSLQLSPAMLKDAISSLMVRFGVSRVGLMGFSIGGRVCLFLAQHMGHSIDRVTLLAPDGLVPNWYYHFCTSNPVGKRLFRHMVYHPGIYLKTMHTLKQLRLLNKSLHKFAIHYINNQEGRMLLGNVWPSLSLIVPQAEAVAQSIAANHIKTAIFMGKYDRVIPPEYGTRFCRLSPTTELHILDKGHKLYDHDNAKLIADTLMQ